MKPLDSTQIKSFLQRFDSFKDSEFRNIIIDSPSDMTISTSP